MNRTAFIAALLVIVGALVALSVYGTPMRTARKTENNPTAFDFPVEKRAVQQAVPPVLERSGLGRLAVETNEDPVFGRDVLRRAGNEDDMYLVSFHQAITFSPVYRSLTGKPLPFIADFHVHIVELSPTSTRVVVRALNPEVINGSYSFPGVHGPLKCPRLLYQSRCKFSVVFRFQRG